MEDKNDLAAFYIVTENDGFGESVHGPYSMIEAESLLQVDEKIITRKQFQMLYQTSASENGNNELIYSYHEKMLRQLRSWGFILLFLGAVQVFTSDFLSTTWGFLLIFVGVSSFYFRSPAMFIIYGSTLAWAAISNSFSGSGGWVAFSLLQVFFSFQTFRQYFHFRPKTPASRNMVDGDLAVLPDKAAKPFPWLSLLFGSVSLIGFVTTLLAAIIFINISATGEIPPFISFIEGLVIDFAVIGFAAGLASLLSRYKYKLISIIGMIAGALTLLFEVGLLLLG